MRWPIWAVVVIKLTGIDGTPFYFPIDSIGPFRHAPGCAGTTMFTQDGQYCVAETPEEIAKKLADAPE